MDKMKKFLNTIYIGDRWCEKVIIENDRILLQINCISRLQKGTTEWNFYNDKNIDHGCIVFDKYIDYSISKGLPFNEYIEIELKEKIGDLYTFVIYVGNISNDLVLTDIEFVIRAKDCYLYDPINDCIITE